MRRSGIGFEPVGVGCMVDIVAPAQGFLCVRRPVFEFSSILRIGSDYLRVLNQLRGLCNGDCVSCDVIKTDF
jgi:hypothetical protein